MENDSREYDHVWAYRKPASDLPASENTMDEIRKNLIRKSLDFDIIDVRSYLGYKGDSIVEITTMDNEVTKAIESIAGILGLETVIKQDTLQIYKIFCIEEATDIYELK
jgi:hypothetical protein